MDTTGIHPGESEIEPLSENGRGERTSAESASGRIVDRVERVVVSALRALIMLLVVAATVTLYILFINDLPKRVGEITSADALLAVMQTSFAGILGVILGLELAETLKAYFTGHQIRLEVILVVATIAVSRQLIQIDFAHASAAQPLGFGGLILCLTLGYVLVKKGSLTSLRQTKESAAQKTRAELGHAARPADDA